jgi:hypothetical protein
MEAFYAAMYHKLSAYTTKSFIYRGNEHLIYEAFVRLMIKVAVPF